MGFSKRIFEWPYFDCLRNRETFHRLKRITYASNPNCPTNMGQRDFPTYNTKIASFLKLFSNFFDK